MNQILFILLSLLQVPCNAAGEVIAFLHFFLSWDLGGVGGNSFLDVAWSQNPALAALPKTYLLFFFFFVSCLLYQSQSWDLFIGWDSECRVLSYKESQRPGRNSWFVQAEPKDPHSATPERKFSPTSRVSQPKACKYLGVGWGVS